MPLQISEIGVRMAVGPAAPAAEPAPPAGPTLSPADHEAIVQECVQRVLAALKAQEAR